MDKRVVPIVEKELLVTPGPTPTPEAVRLRMAHQMIHHRTPEFTAIFKECQEGLKWLFQTESLPLILTCSGTGAFEAALQTFTKPHDKQLCIGGGKFAERWGLMGRYLNLDVTDLDIVWGRCLSEDALRQALQKDSFDLLTLCVSETSTGVLHDLEMVVRVTKELSPHTLIGVDAVTALCVHDIPFDQLGLDFIVSGSQKALALPPGLAFVCASERAWERAEKINEIKDFRRSLYLDLLVERKKQLTGTTACTPAITLVYGLQMVLDMMREEGLEHLFQRHHDLAEYCRHEVVKIGCNLFAEVPSNAVTAISVPDGFEAPTIVKKLQKDYKVKVAGGQDSLKSHLIRIGHLGYIDYPEISYTLHALRDILHNES